MQQSPETRAPTTAAEHELPVGRPESSRHRRPQPTNVKGGVALWRQVRDLQQQQQQQQQQQKQQQQALD
ncbi:hypothetical protein Emag_007183 [Eimeria magna]